MESATALNVRSQEKTLRDFAPTSARLRGSFHLTPRETLFSKGLDLVHRQGLFLEQRQVALRGGTIDRQQVTYLVPVDVPGITVTCIVDQKPALRVLAIPGNKAEEKTTVWV